MAVPGLNRRTFLRSAIAAAALANTGNETRGQEPDQRPGISAPPTIHLSEFNKLRDKTLNKANQLFSDNDNWRSLTEQEKTDFCFRVLKTLAKDKNQTTENSIEEFLENLNTNIHSKFFKEDQMNEIFKLPNYMMLGLGFLSIKKRNPDDETARLFLSEIISESVSSDSTKTPIKTASLGEELYQSTVNGKKILVRYASIRDKYFPQVK
jgi:hypothetical protein